MHRLKALFSSSNPSQPNSRAASRPQSSRRDDARSTLSTAASSVDVARGRPIVRPAPIPRTDFRTSPYTNARAGAPPAVGTYAYKGNRDAHALLLSKSGTVNPTNAAKLRSLQPISPPAAALRTSSAPAPIPAVSRDRRRHPASTRPSIDLVTAARPNANEFTHEPRKTTSSLTSTKTAPAGTNGVSSASTQAIHTEEMPPRVTRLQGLGGVYAASPYSEDVADRNMSRPSTDSDVVPLAVEDVISKTLAGNLSYLAQQPPFLAAAEPSSGTVSPRRVTSPEKAPRNPDPLTVPIRFASTSPSATSRKSINHSSGAYYWPDRPPLPPTSRPPSQASTITNPNSIVVPTRTSSIARRPGTSGSSRPMTPQSPVMSHFAPPASPEAGPSSPRRTIHTANNQSFGGNDDFDFFTDPDPAPRSQPRTSIEIAPPMPVIESQTTKSTNANVKPVTPSIGPLRTKHPHWFVSKSSNDAKPTAASEGSTKPPIAPNNTPVASRHTSHRLSSRAWIGGMDIVENNIIDDETVDHDVALDSPGFEPAANLDYVLPIDSPRDQPSHGMMSETSQTRASAESDRASYPDYDEPDLERVSTASSRGAVEPPRFFTKPHRAFELPASIPRTNGYRTTDDDEPERMVGAEATGKIDNLISGFQRLQYQRPAQMHSAKAAGVRGSQSARFVGGWNSSTGISSLEPDTNDRLAEVEELEELEELEDIEYALGGRSAAHDFLNNLQAPSPLPRSLHYDRHDMDDLDDLDDDDDEEEDGYNLARNYLALHRPEPRSISQPRSSSRTGGTNYPEYNSDSDADSRDFAHGNEDEEDDPAAPPSISRVASAASGDYTRSRGLGLLRRRSSGLLKKDRSASKGASQERSKSSKHGAATFHGMAAEAEDDEIDGVNISMSRSASRTESRSASRGANRSGAAGAGKKGNVLRYGTSIAV